MEAMASGLPCIVSAIRGNVDLIDNKVGGYLCSPFEIDQFSEAISGIEQFRDVNVKMGDYNRKKVKIYDLENVKSILKEIYSLI